MLLMFSKRLEIIGSAGEWMEIDEDSRVFGLEIVTH